MGVFDMLLGVVDDYISTKIDTVEDPRTRRDMRNSYKNLKYDLSERDLESSLYDLQDMSYCAHDVMEAREKGGK